MLPWLVVALALVLVGLLLRRTALVVRRRGAGHVMAPFEEIWRPTALETHAEVRQQSQRRAPAPSPDDA
jgi:hypothetical protein